MAGKKLTTNYGGLAQTTTSSTGSVLTERALEDAIMALGSTPDEIRQRIEKDAKERFFLDGKSMQVNVLDWPAQRKYLSWWIDQFNSALIRTRDKIGKNIAIRVRGSVNDDVMDKDDIQAQKLLIDVIQLSEEEVKKYIMEKIKGKSFDKKDSKSEKAVKQLADNKIYPF